MSHSQIFSLLSHKDITYRSITDYQNKLKKVVD